MEYYNRINIELNGYQLANILDAVRVYGSTGDWYHEFLSLIQDNLTPKGYVLPEYEEQYKRAFPEDNVKVLNLQPNVKGGLK